jgi:Protein of unknown function (DUF3375)
MNDNFYAPDSIKNLLTESPIFRLLKKDTAAFIIAFLHHAFKLEHTPPIKNQDLIQKLAAFMEMHDLTEGAMMDETLLKAKKYIEQWCNEAFLRQYPNELGEHLHELTSYSDRVLRWFESLKPKAFVGTESRFRDILRRLNELMEETTEDPIQKIAELEKKKADMMAEIDEKIRQIKSSGKVEAFSEVQLRERYERLTEDAKELVSDFKEVEHNFKQIANAIYQKQLGQFKKGQILGDLLDETERLQTSPQGKSFYSFWDYLRREDNEYNMYDLTRAIYRILTEKKIPYGDKYLLMLKAHLFDEGQKVLISNNLLMEKLSRTLSEKRLKNRLKAFELTAEIQSLAIQRIQDVPTEEDFFSIELNPKVDWSWQRPLQKEFISSDYEWGNVPNPQSDGVLPDSIVFQHFDIDRQQLIQNIEHLLHKRSPVRLSDVLSLFPLEQGVAELITYFGVAHYFKYEILNETEMIPLNNAKQQMIQSPILVFSK